MAPLFRDPVHDGAADPVLVWNRAESAWWLVFTVRRADSPGPGLAWLHGCGIGYASSTDGRTFVHRGTFDLAFEPGHNTYWAPEVVRARGEYHMWVSFVRGVPRGPGQPMRIHHCTSPDLLDWTDHGPLELSSDRVIDACVVELPGGGWRLWYKDEAAGSSTWSVDSPDLSTWSAPRLVVPADPPHEGPNVFRLGGSWWMLTDEWQGQGVHRSEDLETWQRTGRVLDVPGTREDDGRIGLHADVTVVAVDGAERAYVTYFTHPERDESGGVGTYREPTYRERRTSVQVAELRVAGGTLVCDRDAGDEVVLPPGGPAG